MSECPAQFIDLALDGRVVPDEIDDFVAAWHEGDSREELYEFLGMTFEEYSLWVRSANALTLILSARHRKQPLIDAVNDNYLTTHENARSVDRAVIESQLRSWLAQRG